MKNSNFIFLLIWHKSRSSFLHNINLTDLGKDCPHPYTRSLCHSTACFFPRHPSFCIALEIWKQCLPPICLRIRRWGWWGQRQGSRWQGRISKRLLVAFLSSTSSRCSLCCFDLLSIARFVTQDWQWQRGLKPSKEGRWRQSWPTLFSSRDGFWARGKTPTFGKEHPPEC